ncbi:MAG TPA: hypothetical protein DDW20_06235 [Firmicutes bacterium]|nr:hypothetical protein [Bacillota bacterium]
MPNILKRKIKLGNKEFSFSFILSILSAVFGILFSFFAAKFLKSNIYGEIQYYLSIITLLNSFMLFGVDSYLIKETQFEDNNQKIISKSLIFVILNSMLILPIYFRIGFSFLTRLNENIVLILIIFIIALLSSLSLLGCAFLQGKSKYQIKILISSFFPHFFFLLIFFIHFFTNSLQIFFDLYLLYYAILYGFFGVYMLIKYLFPISNFFSLIQMKTIIYFGLTWVLYNITTPLSNIFIGEKYENLGIVGIFSISNQLLSISGLATGIISQISNTTFAKLANENNIEKLFKNYERITRINIYISVPFFSAFIIEAQNLLGFFGESYLGHNMILILLTLASMIECITGPCGTVLLMGNKEKENLIASIIKFSVFMVVLITLIKHTEFAAPLGLLLSSIISNFIKLLFLRISFKKNFFSPKTILTFVVVFLISSGIFFALSFIKNIIIWAIANGVCGIAMIISFILFTPFKEDKKYFSKGKEI